MSCIIPDLATFCSVTVMVSYLNPFTKMGGTELVYELFSECHKADSFDGLCVATPDLAWELVGSLVFVLVTKFLLTTVTFGIKVRLTGAYFAGTQSKQLLRSSLPESSSVRRSHSAPGFKG